MEYYTTEREHTGSKKQLNRACKKMSHHSFRHALLTASDSLMDRQIYTLYKKKHIIECMSLSFVRLMVLMKKGDSIDFSKLLVVG